MEYMQKKAAQGDKTAVPFNKKARRGSEAGASVMPRAIMKAGSVAKFTSLVSSVSSLGVGTSPVSKSSTRKSEEDFDVENKRSESLITPRFSSLDSLRQEQAPANAGRAATVIDATDANQSPVIVLTANKATDGAGFLVTDISGTAPIQIAAKSASGAIAALVAQGFTLASQTSMSPTEMVFTLIGPKPAGAAEGAAQGETTVRRRVRRSVKPSDDPDLRAPARGPNDTVID